MRAVILGAGGQLAHDLARVMERWDLLKWRHEDLDITDQAAVRARLSQVHVEAVINTTGFHRVEECETQHERAFAVNTYAVRHLAQICREIGAVLVHLSTDYVFGGEKHTPYLEGDLPRPLNVYGASKLAGEHLAAALCPELLVVRSSGLFGVAGSRAKGGNFVETMLRLARAGSTIRVVDDQVLAPTYAYDLACAIRDLLEGGARGLFHLANDGACSWYQLARAIFDLSGAEADLEPTTTAAYSSAVRRPAYSVLGCSKAAGAGIRMRPWRDALQAYLTERPTEGRSAADG